MKNLIAATYTPMHSDGTLHLDVIKPYATFLKSNKVSGAFVNGTTGDFVSLSTPERITLIETWSRNKPEDFVLTNHVGHTNLREAQELAAHSVGLVDAICALPPYYFKPKTLDSLIFYCSEIAKNAPSIPFYYYHIPVLTGADFEMIAFLEMAANRIPNFAGIKYSQYNPNDFTQCLQFNKGSQNILFGVDERLVDSLSLGTNGWVGSTYNHLAPLYTEIIASFKNGEYEKANALQKKAVFFVEILEKLGGYNGSSKSFMRFFGLDMGKSRYPNQTLTDKEFETAKAMLEKNGIFPYLCIPS